MNRECVTATAGGSNAGFPETRWSQVWQVHNARRRSAALEGLCRSYWRPLYAFLRRHGRQPEEARDLVQGFFARLLERDGFAAASADRGRLRTFLLTSLRNHVANETERACAQRRGRGAATVPIEIEEAERMCAPELVEGIDPARAYDRNWGRLILARALQRLGEEHRAQRKEALFEELSRFLDGAAAQEYTATGARLGMTPNAVGVAVHRLRRRLRDLVLAEIEDTVGARAEAEVELKELLEVLAAR